MMWWIIFSEEGGNHIFIPSQVFYNVIDTHPTKRLSMIPPPESGHSFETAQTNGI